MVDIIPAVASFVDQTNNIEGRKYIGCNPVLITNQNFILIGLVDMTL